MVRTFKFDEFGYEVEIGKVARQADGAVWLRQGGTVVIAAVTTGKSENFAGFMPLTVDYREQFAAAGKIPGGYFKREGKTTDREILTGRLIDRSIRPLFPVHFFDQVQVITTVYSVDKDHAPSNLALIASSLALSISKIPFLGPVGVVEISRSGGEWVVNAPYRDSLASDVRLIIAGTEEGIVMVEGATGEISEEDFVDALFVAHEHIKRLAAWQKSICNDIAPVKEAAVDPRYEWDVWTERALSYLAADKVKSLYIADKVLRHKYRSLIRSEFAQLHKVEIEEKNIPAAVIDYIFDYVLKEKITECIFDQNRRIDDRAFDQVRSIAVEVGLLPSTHGSALFTRGRTQALVSVTLGSGQDEQRIESIMEDGENGSFMLHYNFPPFSVGEVRGLRAPSRRETGHGHLARSAFKYLLPAKDVFPYTIRIVADMLESDGSTSMATACGSTMALMQAGVPLKKMVGGIAMGLLQSKTGDIQILSDISGFEDEFGLMDFKVVGTADGITAIQMDIKYKGGLGRPVFEKALAQARVGRLHILGEMCKVMTSPSPTLSPLVPKVVVVKIATDKIGAVIGGNGKIIKEIIEKTGTMINVEPDGTVKIFGGPEAFLDKAVQWVKILSGQIERGLILDAKIRGVNTELGLFVELAPGTDGLARISNLPREHQKTFTQDYKVEDVVRVEILDYNASNGRIGLKVIK